MVEPSSIFPCRLVAPLTNINASASDVLPVPLWPTSTMFRIFSGGYSFIGATSSWMGLVQRLYPNESVHLKKVPGALWPASEHGRRLRGRPVHWDSCKSRLW